jgi:choline-sulfatase
MKIHSHNRVASTCMSRRAFMKLAGAATVMVAGCQPLTSGLFVADMKTPPKNILLILTDQQHIDTIAAAGCKYVNTPAMDKLVKRGVSFTESYTNNPVCSPARSAILTGRTSSETGVYTNGKSIRKDIPNLGQWFTQNSGYETVYAGKWHIPRGFTQFIRGFKVINSGIGGQGNVGDTSTSHACCGYLQNRSKQKPLLMVASFLQPHDICEWLRLNTETPDKLEYPQIADQLPPLPDNFEFDTNEPETIKRKRRSNEAAKGNWTPEHWRYYRWSYYRHIEFVDAEIGRILDTLEDFGYLNDTLIILTSDHGEGMAHHHMVRKSSLYDEAAKVPLVLSWPGRIPANRRDRKHLVSGLDIVPTICDYASIKTPPDMRGRSLRAVLESKSADSHEYIVSEVSSNTGRMVRTQGYKYIAYKDDACEQLFDMKKDPGETKNLAASSKYESILKEHRDILAQWERQLDVSPNVPHRDTWSAI